MSFYLEIKQDEKIINAISFLTPDKSCFNKNEKISLLLNFFNNAEKIVDHTQEIKKSYVSFGFVVYRMKYKNIFEMFLKFLIK